MNKPDIDVDTYKAYTLGFRKEAAYRTKLSEATSSDILSKSTRTRKGVTNGPRAKNMLKSIRVV